MPELPEVEATRRYLILAGLPGSRVMGVDLLWPQAVRTPSVSDFTRNLRRKRIQGVGRRAKFLHLTLEDGWALIFHLRMTGSLLMDSAAVPRPTMTRNVFVLDGDRELRFVDSRKLGGIWLVADSRPLLKGLGPEPLEAEFTPEVLQQQIRGRKAPIKALLCDQAVLAGIGNIYADEVLFLAAIHPLKTGADLSPKEIQRLHGAITDRLAEAVDLLAPLAGRAGPPTEAEEGLETLFMPRSEGASCGECGAPIERVTVRARSSYFCPRCQVM